MNQATVDILDLGAGKAHGSVAQRLLQGGFSINALRTNDVLRNRDWIAVDKKIVEVSRQRLVGVADLMSRGLSYPIANALGVTRVEWERIGDFGAAEVNMSGVAEGRSNRVEFDLNFLPLPIVHKDFNINIRALEASRRGGHPLDTTQAGLATRIVVEKIESMLFTGGPNFGTTAGQIYGYTTAPNHIDNTALGGAISNWTSATGADILDDVIDIIQKLSGAPNYMKGPYMFYVPHAAYSNLGNDYKAESDKTILQRIKEVPGVADVKPSDNLTAGIVVVQMTDDVVDMIDGIQPTAVQWESHGGMVLNFKVMAIWVPRMKSTYTEQSGICYATW